MKRGMFIVIEGADGAGKSTHAARLASSMRAAGGTVATTSEPTKMPIGRLIRQILAPPEVIVTDVEYDWRTMALLFTADRTMHGTEISGLLDEGFVVICERYYLSTFVYQTAKLYAQYKRRIATGGDVEGAFMEFDDARRWLKELSAPLLRPDLTVVLDVNIATLGARLKERGMLDRFERDQELMATVTALYREIARFLPGEQVEVVSAEGDKDEVAKRLMETVLRSAPWKEREV
jgi:dTMP kinase